MTDRRVSSNPRALSAAPDAMRQYRFALGALVLAVVAVASPHAHAQDGGIRFSGMIVEPPCRFAVDHRQMQVRPRCERPVAGRMRFVDVSTGRSLESVPFDKATRAIAAPAAPGAAKEIVATVTYL